MNRNKLYLLLGALLFIGYAWLFWSIRQQQADSDFTPCIFKNVTGIACPSCGSTRSVLYLAKGNFAAALHTNPIGYILAFIMIVIPLWLFYDLLFKRDTLYRAYRKSETVIKIRWVAVLLAALIIANWIWNIRKGL